MPNFRYRAVNPSGRYVNGNITAATTSIALRDLKEKGLHVVDISDKSHSIWTTDLGFKPTVNVDDFVAFCRQLATLFKSGINIVEAMQVLREQTESKVMKQVIHEVTDEMIQGSQLSAACAKHPHIFSPLFINMIRAGEISGNMDEMLERVATFFEKDRYTKSKVKSALIYPVVVGIITIAVVAALLIFVVPRFVANFEQMKVELPLPTIIVMSISNWMLDHWLLLILLLTIPMLIVRWMRTIPRGRYMLDYMMLKLPVFGILIHKQAMARFCRTFSSLYAASVPMLQMLHIIGLIIGNEVIMKVIRESREGLSQGRPLAEPYKTTWVFPPMVTQMLALGEQTGALDVTMQKVADFYEQDVDMMTDRIKSLIEPLMIVFLAGTIGVIVLAVMSPMFKLYSSL